MGGKPDSPENAFDAHQTLDALGGLEDDAIDLGRAALALAVLSHKGISTDRYIHHLNILAQDVAEQHQTLVKSGEANDAATQLEALKIVLFDTHGYKGDSETYDDLQNASLIRVIDRAKGLPIALSILYIHAARAQGWDIAGLNIPGHFVCRLSKDGQTLIFDPFNGCEILEAPDLRTIVKQALGEHAELSTEYYEAASNRDILLRLQNNIKFRQIEAEDYEGALETVLALRKVDPAEYRLLLDEGVLYARTDQTRAAIDSLVSYIEKAPNSRDRMEAELLLQHLRERLN
ncbi:MAG: transglutaminase-like domain-containing protein [Pseudomonadota bacterium]